MTSRPARPVLEEFEPRILYSADFAPAALAGYSLPGESEQRLLQAQETAALATLEIAFVDLSLPDAQSLIDDLQAQHDAGRSIEIVRIEAGEDGISRIGETLVGRNDVSAVHVLSHGADGVLQLGSARLDAATLLARAGELAQWSAALSADADLLLYGCDVAASSTGERLLASLAALTGADVAASSDLTGAAARGGDWALEFASGNIEAGSALSSSAQRSWNGLLLASTNETLVNQTKANTQATSAENRGSQQAVALDAAGNYVVVWTSNGQDAGGTLGVYARRFDSSGAAITGEILVNTTTSDDQRSARVVSDSVGNFVVTWTSSNQDGTPNSVYMRRFDGNGLALTAETRVNTTTTGSQTDSVIAMNASTGDYMIAWQGEGPGDSAGIFFRRFFADGTAKDATDRLANLSNGGAENDPAVTMDASGNFVIFWEVSNKLYFQRFDAAGGAQGGSVQVDNLLSTSSGAAVASDAAGNFTVVYRESVLLPGVWGKGFNADGTVKYTWFQTASGEPTSPSIAMASDGTFVVTYESSGGGPSLAVYARKYNADGTPAGTAFVVNQTASGAESSASVAMIDANNYVIVWSGQGPGDSNGVFVRQFGAPNAAPVITSNGAGAVASISLAENSTLVTTVAATDADLPAQALVYSIVGGGDATLFTIDASTGVLAFLAAPNYEAPTDVGANNVYDVTVQVSDGTLTDTQAIAVTVTPVNDNNPVITSNGAGASASVNIAENATAVTTVSATDADLPAQTLTYSISGGADAAQLVINASTGVLSFVAAPNYEAPTDADANNVYDVTVQASDGAFTDTQAIAVTVTNLNDNDPVITSNGAGVNAAVNVVENSTAVTTVTANDVDALAALTYSISGGADAARFSIDASTGVLSFIAAPNYEAPTDAGANNVYNVTVQVSDGTLSDTQAIAVTVSDANEFPVGTISDANAAANSVAENAGVGTLVGVTAIAVDADATTNAITYTLDNSAGGRFAIDAATGVLSVAGVLDYETSTSHAVTVRATSADGSFSTALFTIGVTDVNEASVGAISDVNAAANQVAENSSAGTLVGITASATDPDMSDVVTYSLIDNAGGRFAIDTTTGVVVVNGALDAETAISHTIVVRVDSTDGSFNTQNFTIGVADVNEFAIGAISDSDAAANAVDENAAIGTPVGIGASAIDADATNSTTTYTLDNSAGGRFAIDSSTGVVTVAGAIDREVASSHAIVVRATSADGSSSTQGFTVAVNPVNDNSPDISSDGGGANASISVAENTTAITTVVASDADLPAQTLTYSIVGGADQALFNINASTGVLSFASAPDYESPSDAGTNNVYDVIVQVSDGGLATAQAISVTVNPVNDASPVITSDGGGANASINVAENSTAVTTVISSDADLPAQTLTYSIIGGADAARFNINASTGVLSFASAPDYESPSDAGANNVYDVVVQVSDGSLSATQAIAVTITAVSDIAPVISSDGGGATASIGVAENSVVVTTVIASDADLPTQALTYSIAGGADAGRFAIDASTGVLSFVAAPDYEAPGDANADNVYDVIVQASDGSLTDTQAIAVSVSAVNDNAPVITSNGGGASAALSLPENSTGVTNVSASDADAQDVLRFAITGGADAARFGIDPVSGALSFVAAPDRELPADANRDNRYEVIVSVSDGALRAQQSLFIDVANVDEAPSIVTNALLLSNGGATLVLLGTDPDTSVSALIYQASSQVGGRFELVAAPGVAVTGFNQAQVDAGAVRFVADGSGTSPTYVLSLSDGVSTVTSGAPNVVKQASPPIPAPPAAPRAATLDTPPAATTTAAAPAAAPPAAALPAAVPATPGSLSPELLAEPRGDTFEPARAPSSSAVVAVPAASTATRDSTVTAVATLAQFALLSESSDNAATAGAPTIDLASALRDRLLGEQLDQQRDSAGGNQRSVKELQAASAVLTTSLSVGYVLWLARGGVLVASLMSALPAWAMVDPLPVLAQMKRRDGRADDGAADDAADDPLEKLFSKARQVVARGAALPLAPATPSDAKLAQGRPAADKNSLEQPA